MKPLVSNSTQTWHTLSVQDVFTHLESNPHGLSGAEATRRLTQYGPNELQAAVPVSPWAVFFGQFKNVLIIILLVATVLSAFLGHIMEAVAIGSIV
ncbi:MAG TPA: ATPase, partial [Deltaproteobacteria bacterium]|nr:ATPase [Deltaproteobacteria bacterium]